MRELLILCEAVNGKLAAVWQAVDASGAVNQWIADAEEAWRGGIADFGEPYAAEHIQGVKDYRRYASVLRRAIKQYLGFPLTVYRSDLEDAITDFIEGSNSYENWATSLDANTAASFAKFAGHKSGQRVLAAITVRDPRAIIMRGKESEAELVIDLGWISYSTDMKIIRRL